MVGSVLAVVVAVGFGATAFALGLVIGAVARLSNPHETAVVCSLFVLGPGLPVGVVWGWVLAPSARTGALTRPRLANQAMLAFLAGACLFVVEDTAWSYLDRPTGLQIDPVTTVGVLVMVATFVAVIASPLGWLIAYPAMLAWRDLMSRLGTTEHARCSLGDGR